jgi:hypothetical protein
VPETLLVTEPQDPVNFTFFDPKEHHDKILGVKGRAASKGRGRGKGDDAPFAVGRGRGKGGGELDGLLNGGLVRAKSMPSSQKEEDEEAYADGSTGRSTSGLPAVEYADSKPSLAELVASDDGSVACWFYRDPKNSVQVRMPFRMHVHRVTADFAVLPRSCEYPECRVPSRKPSSLGGWKLDISRTSCPCGTRMVPRSLCRCARFSNSPSLPSDLNPL